MIKSFKDQTTTDIFNGDNSKAARSVPLEIWHISRRKLDLINAAFEVRDLQTPPGNRLESLKGNLKGFYSIRINDQFRIIFKFSDGNAHHVQIVDYH